MKKISEFLQQYGTEDRRIIEETHPVLLLISLIVATALLAGIHLIYGPPYTFYAAALLSIATPIVTYGLQYVTKHSGDWFRTAKVMTAALFPRYSKNGVSSPDEPTLHGGDHVRTQSQSEDPEDQDTPAADASR